MKELNKREHKKYEITALAYDRKGNLVSIGKNNYTKSHTMQARFAAKANQPARIYLHAEIDALIRAKNRGKKVHRLEIIRYDSNGKPANAKPCACCQLAIEEFDVKEVIHT